LWVQWLFLLTTSISDYIDIFLQYVTYVFIYL
jgi:hypothetical protein